MQYSVMQSMKTSIRKKTYNNIVENLQDSFPVYPFFFIKFRKMGAFLKIWSTVNTTYSVKKVVDDTGVRLYTSTGDFSNYAS
jgi:hypothetical protein